MTASSASTPTRIPPDMSTRLQTRLLAWYDRHRRDLPWRRIRDPYAIWISEVMLQQTQVSTMTPYYLRFLERFPDIRSLAGAPLQTVLKQWEGLGYYSRARHLHQAAQIMRDQFECRVPQGFEQLLALPGCGDYIAAAVASIAFGEARAVVDGNVKRVLARLFRIEAPINTPAGQRLFREIAACLLNPQRPGDHNQSVMELGALICTPRRPGCGGCPLSADCAARVHGDVGRFPDRLKKAPLPLKRLAVVRLRRNGRILLVQRPEQGLLGGMWDLPGAPVPSGEDPAQTVRHHLLAQYGLEPAALRPAGTVRHTYTHFKLELIVYTCSGCRGTLRPGSATVAHWIQPKRLETFPLHKAVLKALALFKAE